MANIEKTIYEMYKYGNYAVHYYNYVKEKFDNEDIRIFTDIILKRKQDKHDEALRTININLNFIKNNNIYHLLLCMKMHILFFSNNEDYKITYKIIKKNWIKYLLYREKF
jgi:hypothetical protein